MSVLIRLSGDSLNVDHQFGRDYLMGLAAVRPFIGAVFSLLIYFTFQANLLQQVKVPEEGSGQFAFYMTAAFLIGFSERFAKQIVRTAETGMGAAGSSVPEAGSRDAADLGAEVGAQRVERGAQGVDVGA